MSALSGAVLPLGCSPAAGGGGGVGGGVTLVEFPDAGEELIIVENSDGTGLVVSGDSESGRAAGLALTQLDGAVTAEFDADGQPTRTQIMGRGVFEFVHNDDGTFSYTLTEDGVVIGEKAGLTPDEEGAANPDAAAKLPVQAQSIESDLELLLCAGKNLDAHALTACEAAGFTVGSSTVLGRELSLDRRAVNAAVLECAWYAINRELTKAEGAECDGCETSAKESTACCERLAAARVVSHRLGALALAILGDLLESALSVTPEDREELCGPPPDVSATFVLRNTDTRENIHLMVGDESLDSSNRVVPGGSRTVTLEDLADGQQVEIRAGRSVAPLIATTQCPEIVGDGATFIVAWNGSSLTCERD